MNITILSKNNFEDLLIKNGINDNTVSDSKNDLFISILDTDGHLGQHFKSEHDNVLILHFDDCSEDLDIPIIGQDQIRSLRTLDVIQAKRILDFIDRNKDRENLFIHCTAGVSRSGAVGTFICEYTGSDFTTFKKKNPNILPNPHVLSVLNKIVWEQKFNNQ